MTRKFLCVVVALLASNVTGCSQREQPALTEAQKATTQAELWAKEIAIFEGRSRGELSQYLDVTSDSYLGWPPMMAQPLTLNTLRKQAERAAAFKGEVVTLEKNGFTMNDNTAILYFTFHRTRLGQGFGEANDRDVDESSEIGHVWTLENGDWKMIGVMARRLPDRRSASIE